MNYLTEIAEKKEKLLSEANNSEPYTLLELGWCCVMLGEYVEAIKWYERAAFTDDTHVSSSAMYELGEIYMCPKFNGSNEQIGISWYKKAALKDKGDINAQIFLGWFYKRKNDLPMAIFWYMKAAVQYDDVLSAAAFYEIGMIHQSLNNRDEALSCFEIASELGDSEAAFQVANYMGLDEIIDKMQIYENLANYEEHRGAMIKLAQMYQLGLGVDNCVLEKDIDESIYWYRKAANMKDEVYAKRQLAKLLRQEKHDYSEAERLTRLANQIEEGL